MSTLQWAWSLMRSAVSPSKRPQKLGVIAVADHDEVATAFISEFHDHLGRMTATGLAKESALHASARALILWTGNPVKLLFRSVRLGLKTVAVDSRNCVVRAGDLVRGLQSSSLIPTNGDGPVTRIDREVNAGRPSNSGENHIIEPQADRSVRSIVDNEIQRSFLQ